MDENAAVSDRIPESISRQVREYADLLTSSVGDSLKAITLFGAATSGAFDPTRHLIKSVLVLSKVDLAVLKRLAEEGVRLGKARICAPLIMTPEYIKTSADTFPLELIEIKQNHVTLAGQEYFDDLSFDDAHVRLQCERELKVVLIGLRQGLLAAAGREKFIGALEQDVGETLVRTMRGMLWLKGQKEGQGRMVVLAEVEKLTGKQLNGLRKALDPSASHGWAEFESLYSDVEALGEIADGW